MFRLQLFRYFIEIKRLNIAKYRFKEIQYKVKVKCKYQKHWMHKMQDLQAIC